MLATTGLVTPMNKQDVNEFSGCDVVIKDLNKLRNKDMLRINNLDFGSP